MVRGGRGTPRPLRCDAAARSQARSSGSGNVTSRQNARRGGCLGECLKGVHQHRPSHPKHSIDNAQFHGIRHRVMVADGISEPANPIAARVRDAASSQGSTTSGSSTMLFAPLRGAPNGSSMGLPVNGLVSLIRGHGRRAGNGCSTASLACFCSKFLGHLAKASAVPSGAWSLCKGGQGVIATVTRCLRIICHHRFPASRHVACGSRLRCLNFKR